ncbi:MAG TPA: hypothetical protein VN633_25855, partial [Bryobacteraceae bacterium]|nr:hypothetical protein [Bryobacteraceae bacterium]
MYRPLNSIWYVLASAAGYSETQWGQLGDVPVPGDYDGDGHAEPAVFRPSDTVWYIRPASAAPYQWQWGTPGDVPVAPLYYGYLAPVPTAQLVNLSHPNLTPNFAVGDTFQI